jgi:hypothetical protein
MGLIVALEEWYFLIPALDLEALISFFSLQLAIRRCVWHRKMPMRVLYRVIGTIQGDTLICSVLERLP